MLNTQVAYWNMVELARHNQAAEQLERANLDEAKRHNLAYEYETSRHNQVGERQNEVSMAETRRSNLMREQVARDTLAETIRNNTMRNTVDLRNIDLQAERNRIAWGELGERSRSNRANEAIARARNAIEEQNAQVNAMNAYSTQRQVLLTDWNNNWRHSEEQARIAETERHNRVQETLDTVNTGNKTVDQAVRIVRWMLND